MRRGYERARPEAGPAGRDVARIGSEDRARGRALQAIADSFRLGNKTGPEGAAIGSNEAGREAVGMSAESRELSARMVRLMGPLNRQNGDGGANGQARSAQFAARS